MPSRSDVEHLINSYSLAYDSNDMAAMETFFASDARFEMQLPESEPVVFEGKDTILRLMTDSIASQSDQRRHVNTNLIVDDTDPEVTRTTHYLTLLATENGQIDVISAGVYRIEIVEDGGRLLMRRLRVELDRPY